MKINNIKLKSGQTYTLSQLFSGENKITIPDLQRDYCWGDNVWNDKGEKSAELVSDFVDNLISIFNEKPYENLTLGLIYGYENPRYHIQLCDGQQRITTLFLLLGMINRKTEYRFNKNLMSDFERNHDDKEPYLQYAIRESTLYFLSDLVCEYFLKGGIKTEDIRKQNWYFDEYDLDASIQSMLAAIKTIEAILNTQMKGNGQIDLYAFGKFILEKLQMLYYDMGNRTRGEETFVIINTTGEPLTATENLKPILIGNIKDQKIREKASQEWEEREEWFWQNRKEGEPTSDKALNVFFVWYWQIRLLQEKSWKNKKPYDLNPKELFLKKPAINEDDEENPDLSKWEESIKLDTIHKYFSALKKLIELCKTKQNAKVLRTIDNKEISLSWFRDLNKDEAPNIILPLIAYLAKFNEPKEFNNFVRRIRKNYFDKKWKDRNKNFFDWRYMVQVIENSNTEEDVFYFETTTSSASDNEIKKIKSIPLNEWYNEEEKWKTNLKKQYCKIIEEWEDHPDFMGDLSFFRSLKDNATIEELSKYFDNYTSTVDLVRERYGEKKNEKDTEKYILSNLFRLFLLYIDCNKVGHLERVSREIEGVAFSKMNRKHFFNERFKNLCTSDSPVKYCENFIKDKIKGEQILEVTESSFNCEKFIKAWLTLKVFNANKNEAVLVYYDGNKNNTGVAAWKDNNINKLIEDESFSFCNSICGFGVKAGGGGSYVHYTDKELWLKHYIIDTPFAGVGFKQEDRNASQLKDNKKVIDEIIKYIES